MRAGEMFEVGRRPAEVARALGVTVQAASVWLRRWKESGREGLLSRGACGRKPRLSAQQRQRLGEGLLKGARQHGYSTDLWTLPRIANAIEKLFGVCYHPGHVWHLMRGMGWTLQRPQRRAKERDEAAIARWVREEWPGIKGGPSRRGP